MTFRPPFSFNVCAMGSILDCKVWEPFPEHLIGYPYVIGLVVSLFGYTPAVGSIVNLGVSAFSAGLVFMLALVITEDSLVALLSGLLFAVVPVFAVYGLETSAEPFSCWCILLALWFCLRLWQTEAGSVVAEGFRWCAYTCALLFAETVKREDVLLALALPVIVLFVSQRDKRARGRSLWVPMIVTSVLALLLCFKIHLLATSQNEQYLLRSFPLTGARIFGFIWGFLSSFGVVRWYGGTCLAVLAGIFLSIRKRRFALLPVVLLVSFIALYATHVRGYYEMQSGRVSPEGALRFSMNIMGLWALTGGLGLGGVVRWLQLHHKLNLKDETSRHLLGGTGAALMLASIVTTVYLRRDAVEDETNSRFNPALVALRAASLDGPNPTFILTMDPLVVQMLAGANTRIVDLESVDMVTIDELIASKARLLLLKDNQRFGETDQKRYGAPLLRVLSLPSRPLGGGDDFMVSLLQPTSTAKIVAR